MRLVDARDLGAWAVEVARSRTTGAYVATGPAGQITFGGMLDAAAAVAGTSPEVTWVDDEWLVEQGVAPWSELPLWLPPSVAPYPWDQDTTAAERAGLRTRLDRRVRPGHAAPGCAPAAADDAANPRTGKAGLDPDREKQLLDAWRSSLAGRLQAGV